MVFSGHTGGLKHVMFFRGDSQLISCADDKTIRVWDRSSGQVSLHASFILWFHTSVVLKSLHFLRWLLHLCMLNSDIFVQEVKKVELSASPSSLEVSKDGTLLTVTYGNIVSFWDAEKYVPVYLLILALFR